MKPHIKSIITKSMSMALILGALTACSDELKYDNGTIGAEEGLTIYIPSIEAATNFGQTRADGEGPSESTSKDLGKEAEFKNLYLLAVDNNGTVKKHELQNSKNTISTNPTYDSYTVPLDPGNYRFYVVANLDDYITGEVDALTSSETRIKEAVLNFADETNGLKLESGNLPMACLAKDIKTTKDATSGVGESTIEIKNGANTQIYADLTFLCSKVRYTILFDKTDENNKFETNDVDLTAADASAVRSNTAFDASYEEFTAKYFEGDITGLDLNKVVYPKDSESPYFNPNRESAPEDLANYEGESWADSDKRAWQGTVYLPENMSAEKPTVINFASQEDDKENAYALKLYWTYEKETDKVSHGIARGSFYDVVIRMNNPASTENTVYVEDWDVKQLTYKLHGNYWLITESSEMEEVKSGEWSVAFGFDCNDEVTKANLESPKIYYGGKEVDFYTIELITPTTTDENGDPYDLDPKYPYYLRLTVNEDLPYKEVIRVLNTGGEYDSNGKTLTKDDLSYFHIKSGILHKRIEIKTLTLNPYLIVDPLTITIDARENYTSPDIADTAQRFINFHANFDNDEEGVIFTLTDHDGLLKLENGKGDDCALKLTADAFRKSEKSTNVYNIEDSQSYLTLDLKHLKGGDSYWTKDHKYTLTFYMEVASGLKVTKTVTIIVKPFSTNYTIYFRDNTKSWKQPHIYIYQLLTLPTDLTKYDPEDPNYDPDVYHEFAGKLVGYVEDNNSLTMQWNGAVRYVFTNNLAFRGWKTYGGPDINDPWTTPYAYDQGFVMFGLKTECARNHTDDTEDHGYDPNHFQWNYDYAYTDITVKDIEKRYNYEINLNADHESYDGVWSCDYCKDLYEIYGSDYNYECDFNGNNKSYAKHTRFYPGIAMKKAEGELGDEGWWKYTLSGVAEPGRTVMFFSDLHLPWEAIGKNYGTEDHRFPADYEAGIPLFDFADNEGWMLFDGNSTNRDQHFYDNYEDIPTTDLLPNIFDSNMAAHLQLQIKLPNETTKNVESIDLGHYNARNDGYKWYFDSYNDNINQEVAEENIGGNIISIDLKNNPSLVGTEYLYVKVNLNNNTYKEYQIPPKFFKNSNGTYVTVEPLYLEYNADIKLFFKWNDVVTISKGWDEEYSYYNNGVEAGGTNTVTLYEGKSNLGMTNGTLNWTGGSSTIGAYKYIKNAEIKAFTSTADRDVLTIHLRENYFKRLKVEDLPKNYYPKGRNYLINWHMLKRPDWEN